MFSTLDVGSASASPNLRLKLEPQGHRAAAAQHSALASVSTTATVMFGARYRAPAPAQNLDGARNRTATQQLTRLWV